MSAVGLLLAVGALAISIAVQWAITRWVARRYADRLRPGWTRIAADFALEPSAGPLGVALRYTGQLDGHRVHAIGYRRWFSKMSAGWRAWRVIVVEIDAQWRCAPKREQGVIWSVDPLGYQGSRTLRHAGEALSTDAPEVAPGVVASAARDLEPAERATLERRVATGQAWILSDRVSLAWTNDADDEGEALAAALADARTLARLATSSG